MRAASVLSTHPVVAIALGEAIGQVLEALDGARPTFVLVAVTPPHLGTLDDVGATVGAVLAPDVVVGAVAPAVVGGGHQAAAGPALALFAITAVAASPLSLEPDPAGVATPGHQGLCLRGAPAGATAAVVLGDPFSCRGPSLLAALGDIPASGGLVRGIQGSGGSRLLLDDRVRTSGAVGAFLEPPSQALTSQGGTPVGEAWVVTRADGCTLLELAGQPAATRQRQALGDDRQSAALGLLVDERAEDPGRGDLLAVTILGSGPGGSLRLSQPVGVGQVVRFLRTGPAEVQADLVAHLASPVEQGLAGILLFPSSRREGDSELASELFRCPVAGMGVSAPLGPVGRRPALHGVGATGLVRFPCVVPLPPPPDGEAVPG